MHTNPKLGRDASTGDAPWRSGERRPTWAAAVERREAPPSYVTGGRGRLASVPGGPTSLARQGSLANSPAPPRRSIPSLRGTEKRDTGAPAPQRIGPAKLWLFSFTSPACGGGRERSEAGGGPSHREWSPWREGPPPRPPP